jgi:hypothetical protein
MNNLLTDDIHGKLGESPNSLYKNYVKWFKKTYDSSKTPLTFKAWLAWAKNKKVVMSADGDSNAGVMQTLEVKIREIQLGYVVIGAAIGLGLAHALKNKDKIGLFVAGGAVLGAIVSLAFPKIKVETSAGDDGGTGGNDGGGSGGGGGSTNVGSSSQSATVKQTIAPSGSSSIRTPIGGVPANVQAPLSASIVSTANKTASMFIKGKPLTKPTISSLGGAPNIRTTF